MSDAEPGGDEIAAVLARFPGPVTLRRSVRRWLGILAICLAFTAIGYGMIRDPAALVRAQGWGVLLFFGLGSLVGIAALLPGASTLTLDAEGFTVRGLFRRATARWSHVDDFAVVRMRLGFRPPMLAGYNDRLAGNRTLARASMALAGRNGGLPDTYGLAADDLVRLMGLWRARALAEDKAAAEPISASEATTSPR